MDYELQNFFLLVRSFDQLSSHDKNENLTWTKQGSHIRLENRFLMFGFEALQWGDKQPLEPSIECEAMKFFDNQQRPQWLVTNSGATIGRSNSRTHNADYWEGRCILNILPFKFLCNSLIFKLIFQFIFQVIKQTQHISNPHQQIWSNHIPLSVRLKSSHGP